MATRVHTTDELRDLLATVITGFAGGTKAKWSKAIGPVEKLSVTLHPRSNWRIASAAHGRDREVIEHAAEVVRVEHPYVAGQ